MRALIISGLSGSGKSSAIRALEDVGFYCVDNLPVSLLPAFLELSGQSVEEIQKLAVVVDARDKKHIGRLPQSLDQLSKQGLSFEVLFFEASDAALIRRFSETRRRHPLSPEGSVADGISAEKKLLAPLRKVATQIVDTSEMSTRDLREFLSRSYSARTDAPHLTVQVSSFGFKHGLPMHADLVLDIRFLPNPFFKEDLKSLDGTHPKVREYVLTQPDASELLDTYNGLLEFLLPRFDREGKSYLHVAIGCTGGRHRSVAISTEVAKKVKSMGYEVTLTHRDLEREDR